MDAPPPADWPVPAPELERAYRRLITIATLRRASDPLAVTT
ncbi:hypothetical protein [Actinoplanes sp. DH11]|nr:hypothetical protein [Actinoplanes sp. DH11]